MIRPSYAAFATSREATARRDQPGNPATAIGPGTASEGAKETATSRPHSWRATAREGSASAVPRSAIARAFSDQLDVSFRCGLARSQFAAVSKKVPFPCCVSPASIGHNRANAIPENEPSSEPECEGQCEVRQHITLTPDREIRFRRAGVPEHTDFRGSYARE